MNKVLIISRDETFSNSLETGLQFFREKFKIDFTCTLETYDFSINNQIITKEYDATFIDFSNISRSIQPLSLIELIKKCREVYQLRIPIYLYSNHQKHHFCNYPLLEDLLNVNNGHYLLTIAPNESPEEIANQLAEILAPTQNILEALGYDCLAERAFFWQFSEMKLADINFFVMEDKHVYREKLHRLKDDLFTTPNRESANKQLEKISELIEGFDQKKVVENSYYKFHVKSLEINQLPENLEIRNEHKEIYETLKNELVNQVNKIQSKTSKVELSSQYARILWVGQDADRVACIEYQTTDLLSAISYLHDDLQYNWVNAIVLQVNDEDQWDLVEQLMSLPNEFTLHLIFPQKDQFLNHATQTYVRDVKFYILNDVMQDGEWRSHFLEGVIESGEDTEDMICSAPVGASWENSSKRGGVSNPDGDPYNNFHKSLRNEGRRKDYENFNSEIFSEANNLQERISLDKGKIQFGFKNETKSIKKYKEFRKIRARINLLHCRFFIKKDPEFLNWFDQWKDIKTANNSELPETILEQYYLWITENFLDWFNPSIDFSKVGFNKYTIENLTFVYNQLLPEEKFHLKEKLELDFFLSKGRADNLYDHKVKSPTWKVLHIEDQFEYQKKITELLKKEGVICDSVYSYEAAINKLKKPTNPYRIVICDWRVYQNQGKSDSWNFLQCADFLNLYNTHQLGESKLLSKKKDINLGPFAEVFILTSKETAIKKNLNNSFNYQHHWFYKDHDHIDQAYYKSQFIREIITRGEQLDHDYEKVIGKWKDIETIERSTIYESYRRFCLHKERSQLKTIINFKTQDLIKSNNITPIQKLNFTASGDGFPHNEEIKDLYWIAEYLIFRNAYFHFKTSNKKWDKDTIQNLVTIAMNPSHQNFRRWAYRFIDT